MQRAPAPEGTLVREVRRRALAAGQPREVELLLYCARVDPGPVVTGRIRELLEEEVDWEAFLDLARRHGVWPLIHRTLTGVGSEHLPAEVANRLRRGAHAMTALVQFRITELLALLRLFEAHGIAALPFKGVALGAFAYGSPFRRKAGDYDLLVRRGDFERVRELLVARGYRPRIPVSQEARYLRTRAGSTFEHPDGNVDLHWTLEQQAFDSLPFSFKLDAGGVWERSVPVDLGGVPVRTLCAEDMLPYLCAHGARHSWAAFYSVCDVAELIRAAPDLDWAHVREEVQRHRTERIFHLGLLLARGLLDVELPEEVRRCAESDSQALALAGDVSGWVFDPDSTAKARWHDLAGTIRHYRYRVNLLERPSEKTAYLIFRGLRKLSNSLTSPFRPDNGRTEAD